MIQYWWNIFVGLFALPAGPIRTEKSRRKVCEIATRIFNEIFPDDEIFSSRLLDIPVSVRPVNSRREEDSRSLLNPGEFAKRGRVFDENPDTKYRNTSSCNIQKRSKRRRDDDATL